MFAEALAIWQGLAARDAEARAYTTLGDMAHARHDYEVARAYLTAALVAWREGRFDEARALLEESLALAQASGWRTVLWWPVHSLGALARAEGRLDEARERLQEAIALCPKLARRPRLSDCLEDFAGVVFDEGNAERAAQLIGAADALRTAAATPVPPAMRASVDDLVRGVREALGADAFEHHWTAGMSLG